MARSFVRPHSRLIRLSSTLHVTLVEVCIALAILEAIHLTDFLGFALAYWFSNSDHPGDWVFTVGGYVLMLYILN
jgi:hypothetical protein